MKVYSADVKVFATAYVVAESETEARELLREACGAGAALEVEDAGSEVQIEGAAYSSLTPRVVSLSPAMTLARAEAQDFAELTEEDV